MNLRPITIFCVIVLVFVLHKSNKIKEHSKQKIKKLVENYYSQFVSNDLPKENLMLKKTTTKFPKEREHKNNHTMLKADFKDVVEMINNMKNIEIDKNQLEIYNKYQEKKKLMQGKEPEDNQNNFYAGFYSDKRLPAAEQDKRLRARKDVIHPHPFPYLINNPQLCYNQSVFLIIYVHTGVENFRRRDVIRRTWGNILLYSVEKNINVKLVFVMGVKNETNPEKIKRMSDSLQMEQEVYGDLVQEDFIDTYHNLTYKGVAALKWISLYCPQATYVLKTDDDIFVNMYSLLRYLKKLEKDDRNTKGLILCAVWYQMSVLRKGKWKVLENEWASSVYPTYCSGSAFIMSTDVALILHEVSYYVPFFWVDDFYITGLLPLKAGNMVHRQFHSAYVLNGDLLETHFTGAQWQSYIFSHLKQLNRIINVWKKMTRLEKRIDVAKIKSLLPGQVNASP